MTRDVNSPASSPANGVATDPLVVALTNIVGGDHVLTDADMRAGYETDWTGRYHGTTRCVVRPSDTAEVAAVVAACAAHGAAIVTQGGNTGLVGGGVPRSGEVVLSMARLTVLDAVDPAASQVTAGAGVTIAALQRHARASGLDFAVDWGARDSATVGGAVATNAGGSRVVRFGTMRAQVMGVQAVLADGAVITDLSGLPKETLGPHLPALLVGSEGTLAVITAARLRLVPWYRQTAAALVTLHSLGAAVSLLAELRRLPHLDAAEILLPEALSITCDVLGIPSPVDPSTGAAFVLVDCAAHQDPADELAEVLYAHEGVFATGPRRDQLLHLRDHVSAAINTLGVPLKLDVAVPVAALPELVERTRELLRRLAPSARLVAFGHLAEGNLHLNVLNAGDASTAITDAVLRTVIELGGTISAEHGVGVAKTAWVSRVKGEAAAGVLRAVKHALDPAGILNPGVLFD